MFDRFQHHRPMICGVCAWMADKSGVPVLLIRIASLVLLVVHAPLMVIGYFVAAYLLRREARTAQSAWPVQRDATGMSDRFAHIDRRVAEMEEAAWREQYRGRWN